MRVLDLIQANKVSIEYTTVTELNRIELITVTDAMWELLLDLDKISKNGRHIYLKNNINNYTKY